AVRGLTRAVWSIERQTIGHEQDRRGALPDRLEPIGLGAGMQQCSAAAVSGELADPEGNDVTIEGWVKKRAAEPPLSQAVVALRVVVSSAPPRAGAGSGGIQIEGAEPLEAPAGRDVTLRLADAGLMRPHRQGAARRRHSGMSSPSSMTFAGSTATSP